MRLGPVLAARAERLVRSLGPLSSLVLGSVLAWSGLGKLIDQQLFSLQLAAYGAVPQTWVPSLAVGVMAVEVVLGAALLCSYGRPWPAASGGALLLLFSGLALSVLVRGLKIPCGCFSNAELVSPGTVARSLGLAALAAYAYRHDRQPFGTLRVAAGVLTFAVLCARLVVPLPVDSFAVSDASGVMAQDGYVELSSSETTGWDGVCLDGDVVLVVLTPVCPACSETLPSLANLERTVAGPGLNVRVLWVSQDVPAGPRTTLTEFWHVPQGLPSEATGRFPTVLLVRRNGSVEKAIHGKLSESLAEYLAKTAAKTLAGD